MENRVGGVPEHPEHANLQEPQLTEHSEVQIPAMKLRELQKGASVQFEATNIQVPQRPVQTEPHSGYCLIIGEAKITEQMIKKTPKVKNLNSILIVVKNKRFADNENGFRKSIFNLIDNL
ncbi:4388_t:CDS:2 [Cetraspora pellucida]|uniref:4388_t:CDS:1 n=1 Tax=Cetraspora pellucida TaxID=1433469 RepID=A0A9N8YW44_9GLOM|nr:4388_t:CDS:2 [Cetraspora pellucida]